MKKIIIRWALKQLKRSVKNNPGMSYSELESYGVEDIVTLGSGEKAFII